MLPQMTRSFIAKYVAITAGYSLARTIPRVWDAMIEHKNKMTNKYETHAMLTTEKVVMCMVFAVSGPWLWPVHLSEDIMRLECYYLGKKPAEYGLD